MNRASLFQLWTASSSALCLCKNICNHKCSFAFKRSRATVPFPPPPPAEAPPQYSGIQAISAASFEYEMFTTEQCLIKE